MSNALAVMSMNDMEKMAVAFSKSRLFGMESPEQALSLMLIAQAEGVHPATAIKEYHIIKGRPALKADAMLGRFQRAGGQCKFASYTDQKVSAYFSHPVNYPEPLLIEWTLDMAKAAGLTGKDVWRQYPRAMLRSRVISEGIRAVAPDTVCGIYTPEEIDDAPEAVRVDAKPEVSAPKPKVEATDAEVVTVAPLDKQAVWNAEPEPSALSEKTLLNLTLAEQKIGTEAFIDILTAHKLNSISEITSEELAGKINVDAFKVYQNMKKLNAKKEA